MNGAVKLVASSVVEQDVDRAVLGADRLDRGAHRRAVGDIEHSRACGEPLLAQLVRGLVDFCRLAPVEHDRRAGARETPRDGEAQAAVRTSDERDLAGEIERCVHVETGFEIQPFALSHAFRRAEFIRP